MTKRLFLGFLALIGTTGLAGAQDFLDDQFLLQDPALTASVIHIFGEMPCAESNGILLGSWSSFLCERGPQALPPGIPWRDIAGVGTDALGGLYSVQLRNVTAQEYDHPTLFGDGNSNTPNLVYEIERRDEAGPVVIALVPQARVTCQWNGTTECCTGCGGAHTAQKTDLITMAVDNIHGHLYFALRSSFWKGGTQAKLQEAYGIVRISGLPTLLDVVPEGPVGPQGPSGPPGVAGPPGPPGQDADPSRLTALEQLAAEQQARIDQLEALIQQLLGDNDDDDDSYDESHRFRIPSAQIEGQRLNQAPSQNQATTTTPSRPVRR